MKMEVLHITELPSYLEGNPTLIKRKASTKSKPLFLSSSETTVLNLQTFAWYVPEIAVFLRTWLETKFGVS